MPSMATLSLTRYENAYIETAGNDETTDGAVPLAKTTESSKRVITTQLDQQNRIVAYCQGIGRCSGLGITVG